MKSLDELITNLKHQKSNKVAVAQAADKEVLLAVKKAVELQLATFILTGDKEEIQRLAEEVELDVHARSEIQIVDCLNEEASLEAVKSVNKGSAHVVMKGNVDTKSLLKAVLDKQYGLRTGRILSHVALFEIPGQERLIFLTDSAMNIAPTLEEKVQIVKNAVDVAKRSGWAMPKVAPLAAVEVINPSMQATIDAASLTQMNRRGQISGCVIDGPLAFDNAVSRISADQKGINSEVAGNADILMVPTIEVANALYKSFMYFAHAKVAAVISGASAPIVLTSRSDTSESKVYSLALALHSSK
ncbi:phosphate butyryltransferase [Halobacillus andaensis]|uniref:Phosphate butyryltransferase n=1 Tax=Halobacillus andaensis TaxID=1176239 RepID=A0A917AXP0_HALAA|nr:phosphate butyryltransferase [Halobacillus andaensis]MBP2003155.1 phosphate butyryltransferase [Halobacillus andaensis]GGF08469.1 phosphate butyryltransferase [Halobacillus andaensis]